MPDDLCTSKTAIRQLDTCTLLSSFLCTPGETVVSDILNHGNSFTTMDLYAFVLFTSEAAGLCDCYLFNSHLCIELS